MTRRLMVSMLATFFISAVASGYSWDGEDWADPAPFLGPITKEVQKNCRAIMASEAGQTRVKGRMATVGDSITESRAYFTGILGSGVGANETGHDFNPVLAWLSPAIVENGQSYPAAPNWNCWYRNPNADVAGSRDDWRKGKPWACVSRWRISDAVAAGHPAEVVKNTNSSWALIMFGTNDQGEWSGNLEAASHNWKASYKAFAQGFIDIGVIPVLSTIPPMHKHIGDKRYLLANARIKEICAELKVPYVDYYAYIMHHQPGDAWDGAVHGEDRLIGKDGTHPGNATGNFSKIALTHNGGYRARTFLTLVMAEKVRDVIFLEGAPD